MRDNSLEKLEYFKILENVSNFAKTSFGKNFCLNLKPTFDRSSVILMQKQTSDIFTILIKYGKPPIDDFNDIDLSLKKLSSNITLSAKELLDVAFVLKTSRELFSYFNSFDNAEFESVSSLFSSLYSNIDIEKNIYLKVLDENTIDDKASDELYSIRKSIKNLESQIREKLNKFIHSSTYSKYIMEPIVTIRNNRFVIPVKDEYKNTIDGFIHDISSSGSTVFIEPTSIFNINNEINTLKIKENIEIEKILANLSGKIVPIIDYLYSNLKLITELDVLFAKAEYGKYLDAISPIINDKKEFNLIKARHPLILKDQVVPIDINLGKENLSLVITGPNTGGKTVTLKTVGLLHLMTYSGMMIPADQKSSIYVFDNIFADIGDEQSIAQSLSTFSSHMKTIIDICNNATDQSMILLDELGSGTDPIEGSSLAISILEYFYTMGSLCLSTTHYSEIKNYALTHTGFINASAEFDVEKLKPTYNIILGIPGKSNALEISKRLGLDEKILKRASSFIPSEEIKIEDLLKSIYDEKEFIKKEKEEILKNSEDIKLLKEKLLLEDTQKIEKANKLLEDSKVEARDILLSAKDTATNAIKQINEISNSSNFENLKQLNNIRNSLNDNIKNLSFSDYSSDTSNIIDIANLTPGTRVIINSLNQKGIIDGKVSSGRVFVLVGNNKLNIKVTDLSLDTSENKKDSSNKVTSSSNIMQYDISSELNLIGLNVEDAIWKLDKYLDSCSLSSLKTVRIIHGKGTGKLRSAIHKYLKENKHVKSYRLGVYGEGETGVTIVELK